MLRPVEDRLPAEADRLVRLRGQLVALLAAVLSAQLVVPVGVGRGHDRAEPAVVELVRVGRVRDEGNVLLQVVAGGVLVRAGPLFVALDEAVEPAVAVLMAAGVPAVGRVGVVAALVVGGEVVGRDRLALGIGIGEALVARVGVGMPAEVVVEGAVLHHQDHERVDRHVARARVRPGELALRSRGDELVERQDRGHPGGAGEGRRPGEELAALQVGGRMLLLHAVGELRVGELAAPLAAVAVQLHDRVRGASSGSSLIRPPSGATAWPISPPGAITRSQL